MIVVGIDPGIQGAIAFLDSETDELIFVQDMPIDKVQTGKHVRSRINRPALLKILMQARGAVVFTERPEGHPMRQTNKQTGQTEQRQVGAAGMLAFGENYGCIIMACTAADMRLTEIRPGQWKRAMSFGSSKDDVRRRIQELYPPWAVHFELKKHDGRAEAVGIARYGVKTLGGHIVAAVAA